MRGVWLCAIACAACADPASSDPGVDALLQIPGAQFRPGPFPSPSGGPDALSLATTHAEMVIGRVHERFVGVLAPGARSAAVGLDGFDGAWLLPAGPPAFDTPGDPSVAAAFGLGDAFPPGPVSLVVAAGDADGRFGDPARAMIVADDEAPPAGTLVIALAWDSAADLDLHVVDPLGGEAFSDVPNTWQPPKPGEDPADPDAWRTGGILDHDGNMDCHRDGRPSEHVVWTMPPPAGDYVVRVDTRAMCGDASASWYVAAYRDGELLGAARGVSVPYDTQAPHGLGAGVTALRFSL